MYLKEKTNNKKEGVKKSKQDDVNQPISLVKIEGNESRWLVKMCFKQHQRKVTKEDIFVKDILEDFP